jgi:hypothetical protein
LNLYSGEPQHEVFPRLKEMLPTSTMMPAAKAFQFPEGERIALPVGFEFENASQTTEAFIKATDTSALLVLKAGKIRFEEYWLTGGRDVHWISWSVAKSFLATLVGIAIEEGFIESIDLPITHYATSLKGSAYDGVSIKNALQMSSGARWNEDYSDPKSDVHRLGAAMAGATSLATFVASIEQETEPGSLCQYNSADTQALGMMLVAATGRSIASYMQEKLCEPLGMESAGYWLVDNAGMEMVLGGLNLTARDFAKIGELYRNNGRWHGAQIVPQDWVESSIKPDAPHLQTGKVIVGGHVLPLGYGYQWWVPEGTCGEFSAIGVYNQFVYVDPSREVVIVKLSANRSYGTTTNEAENQEMETIEFLRAIARAMD